MIPKATKEHVQRMYEMLTEQQLREPYDLRFLFTTEFTEEALAFCNEKRIILVPDPEAPFGKLYMGLHLEP